MRHYFSSPVAQLSSGVRAATTPPLLIAPPGLALARAPGAARALAPAVARASDVTHRAQEDGTPAAGILTADDVQRDHGPRRRRRGSTSARTCANQDE